MKRISAALAALLGCALLFARDRVVERTYLSTDKTAYVAGDNIWISAFCLDASDEGRLSDFSSLTYVELCSARGVEATCKIALDDGRGSGFLAIPRALPTGNYKLLAYTAQNRNEVDFDYFADAKTISVFNTFTAEREEDNVRLVSDAEYGRSATRLAAPASESGVALSISGRDARVAHLRISSELAQASSLSVSVFHEDAIAEPRNEGIASFLDRCSRVGAVDFTQTIIPDFEGEVIRAHCTGEGQAVASGNYAVISLPGDLSGIYYSEIADDGSITFYTNNYYGDNMLVCEIEGEDEENAGFATFELESPFVENKVADMPQLEICPSLGESLTARSVGMQIEKLFAADTLYDMLPRRPNLLFGASDPVTYVLKDYTRFPLMSEVFVEFVKGLRFRQHNKQPYVHVVLMDSTKPDVEMNRKSLALVDGVPVFDHKVIYDYDPHLVERIEIYPSVYFIGPRSYPGVVDFVTYKRNMPAISFPESVRMVDFQGACYPMAYTCKGVSENDNYPDYRSTLYWHPAVELPAGASFDFDCQLPAYEGRFRVVVEGISADGHPVGASITFKGLR